MQEDIGGLARLWRSMAFISQELRESGEIELAQQIDGAMRFSGGSPSEFLGESMIALEAVRGHLGPRSPSAEAFAMALLSEIREGFRRVGGG